MFVAQGPTDLYPTVPWIDIQVTKIATQFIYGTFDANVIQHTIVRQN